MNENILQKISEIIIECANNREIIEYNRISKRLEGVISPYRLNEPLGEISLRCIKHGFPPLSAIVVNQGTRMPGEGFFTWVASKMGYPDLAPSKWNKFYDLQKERVFNCDNWKAFLEMAFSNQSKKSTLSYEIDLDNILLSKDYLKGKPTQYYILTVKYFYENKRNGPYQYHVFVLEQDKVVNKIVVEDNEKKQLLTLSKRKGIQLLLNYSSCIGINDITMMHYKPDRTVSDLWEKESRNNLETLYLEERFLFFNFIVENDIDSEKAQEEFYYKDGKVIEYFGTRFERNPINRAKAIEIHGVTCKVCGFNFEKVYGNRGKDYIEVHHINPLYSIDSEMDINPEIDLVPVCSNCHKMIHRNKKHVLTVDELKKLIVKPHYFS